MLFKKKSKRREKSVASEKLSHVLSVYIHIIKQRFVNFMTAKTKNLSIRQFKLLLIAFCLIGFGISLYLMGEPFIKPLKQSHYIKVTQIHLPALGERALEERLTPDWYISREDYRRVEAFRHYMDSVYKNNRVQYDSIIFLRPGLMDSVSKIEQLYKQQSSR